MVPAFFAGSRIDGQFVSRKDVLPCQRSISASKFALQRERQVNATISIGEIALMNLLDTLEMKLQRLAQTFRQNSHAVAQTLAVPDGDVSVAEIDVFNP